LQAGGRRFDPDRLHQYGFDGCIRTPKILKPTGIEAGLVFFENM
jgi:hypothetical protein